MLASIRRLSKSTVGTVIMALFLLAIVASFAMADIQGVLSGGGIGGSSDTLVQVGSEEVTDRDVTRAMDRRLSQARQENPEATYSTIIGDFDQLLAALVDARTLEAFASKFDFNLSRRLEDAQIANIPAAKGLGGQFTEQSYRAFLQQQRMSDEEVRMIVRNGLLQQLMIAPVVVNARAPVGMATPYASILLEAREGEVAFVPIEPFRTGLNPTSGEIQNFYAVNRQRYVVPEQRVLRIARIGPEQVANVQATDKEIADYYNTNRAAYAPRETRVISQAVIQDEAAAKAIAQRLRSGQAFAAAAAPAGLSAEDIAVGPQTKAQLTELAGAQMANAAFSANEGAVIGPVNTELGWRVVKIDDIQREGGKSLGEARDEIAEKLAAEKRREAIDALVVTVEEAIDDGSSFAEAVAAARLTPIETPPIIANGTSRTTPDYRLPEELAPALKSGFELAENDAPVVDALPNDAGYVLVAPARVIAAAPAPLETIRDKVTQDWITTQATQKARQLAQSITNKAGQTALQQAAKGAPVPVPVETIRARRIQLTRFQGNVPPPLAMLFSLGQGKGRMVAGSEGEGFYVVKVNRIIPGNALNQPSLIGQTQQQMQQALSQEYGQQFLNAMRQAVGVDQNENAVQATKARISGSGG